MKKTDKGLVHSTSKNLSKEEELGQPIGLICITSNMSMMVCSFCKPTIAFNEILSLINHIKDFHGFILFDVKEEFIDENFEKCQTISLHSGSDKNLEKHDYFYDISSNKSTAVYDCQQIDPPKFQNQNLFMVCDKNADKGIEIHLNQFYCTNCKSNFKLEKELMEHICSYNASRSETSIRSAILSSKRMHLHVHNLQRTYKCNFCLKRFYTSTALRNHLMIHTQRRKYKCKYCDKTFKSSILLWRHRKLNHLDKPNKSCIQLNSLKKSNDQRTVNDKNKRLHNKKKQNPNKIQLNEFHCNICNIDFKLEDELRQHICLKSKTFQCKKCARSFASNSYFKIHMRIHNGEKPFKCHLCPLAFHRKDLLKRHITKHAEKIYKCEYENCNRSYTKKSSLLNHICSYTGENPFKCNLCSQEFRNSNLWQNHMRKHDKKQFMCEYENCDRSYSFKSSLDFHIRSHFKENPTKCEFCSLEFHESKLLRKHMKKHTKQRYKCEYENCDRSYSFKPSLLLHIRSHTGGKPFKCNLCYKGFNNSKTLKKHMKNHTKEPYKCNYENCDRLYLYRSSLLFHIRSHTEGKTFKCKLCSLEFCNSALLAHHRKTHIENRYKCDYENCDRSYSSKSSLIYHNRSHTEGKTFICKICSLEFCNRSLLGQHMKTHTENHYKCKYENCDRSYSCKSSLLLHIQSHKEVIQV